MPKEIEDLKETKELKLKVIEHALKEGGLDMEYWHACDTTHCIAGWATHLAGVEELEERYPVHLLGKKLLGEEWADRFYDNDVWARKFLEEQKEILTKGE